MRHSPGPIAITLVGAFATPLFAQQTVESRPAASATTAPAEVAAGETALRAVVFEDRVASGGFDVRKWAALSGDTLTTGNGAVVRIGCDADPQRPLVTRPISLSNLLSAAISIDVLPAGTPAPGPLTVEWADGPGEWRLLSTIDGQESGLHVFDLPPFALGGSVRIRIAPRGGGSGWLVRSVAVTGAPTAAWSRVQIDSQPLEGGSFAIITDSVLTERNVESPALLLTPTRSVRLIAPAEIGGRPFQRWDLGPDRAGESRRGVLQNLDSRQPAVAHYAAEPDTSRIAAITFDTLAAEGPHFAVAFADDPAFVIEPVYPGDSIQFLVGETVLVAAPPRYGRMVFSHWSLGGKPVGNDSALLTLAIERSGALVAAYELLGDMNDDDLLDKRDVELFILALADPAAYQQRYPTVDRRRRGDINGDGQLDQEDIRSFVELVLGE